MGTYFISFIVVAFPTAGVVLGAAFFSKLIKKYEILQIYVKIIIQTNILNYY